MSFFLSTKLHKNVSDPFDGTICKPGGNYTNCMGVTGIHPLNGSLALSQALSQASGNSNLKVSCIRGSDSVWRGDRLSWFIPAGAFSPFKTWPSRVASLREQARIKWDEPRVTRETWLELELCESTQFSLDIHLRAPQKSAKRSYIFSTTDMKLVTGGSVIAKYF